MERGFKIMNIKIDIKVKKVPPHWEGDGNGLCKNCKHERWEHAICRQNDWSILEECIIPISIRE